MTTTLCVRETPETRDTDWSFKQPLKGIIARRYYAHDGSLSSGKVILDSTDRLWLEGVLAAFGRGDEGDKTGLKWIINTIDQGHTVDMWIE